MKVMITGAAGFIGSHLCETLVEAGHSVFGLDNLDPYYSPAIKLGNVRQAQANMPFAFCEEDILDRTRIEELVHRERPEVVVHLAARPGVAPSVVDPYSYLQINITGTLNLLRACVSSGVRRVIFASSSSIYGSAGAAPCREDCILSPLNVYAASKVAGEALCQSFSNLHGIESVCLRFFTVYGPRQRPDMAIAKFTKAMINNQPITLRGDTTCARDYTYIADIVTGIRSSVVASLDKPWEAINLGNSHPITLRFLIKELSTLLGKEPHLIETPLPRAEAKTTCAENSKALKVLGYTAKTNIREGLRKYVESMPRCRSLDSKYLFAGKN